MKKTNLENFLEEGLTKFKSGTETQLYLTKEKEVLKLFSPQILAFFKAVDCDVESKVMTATKRKQIVTPTSGTYQNGIFCGYTTPLLKGQTLTDHRESISLETKENLYHYANLHSQIETIVTENEDVVFPDLCTCGNIFINFDGIVSILDYDGLQVGKHKTNTLSSYLGEHSQYRSPKYLQNGFFTKEIDKKSLVTLYFFNAFNADISGVGSYHPITKEPITLDGAFEFVGLDDYDIMNKIWKCFHPKQKGEYLGDDLFYLAENYQLKTKPLSNGGYVRKLIKK